MAAPNPAPPVARQPATPSDPSNAGSGQPADFAQLEVHLKEFIKEKIDECAGVSELDDVRSLVLGVARIQETIGCMMLLLCQSLWNMQPAQVAQMIVAATKDDKFAQLLKQLPEETSAGKG